jgi:Zn-dependent alcohol dehydrogenase
MNIIKNTFQSAVMFEQNEPLKIVDLPMILPGDGQVLVKLVMAGICGAQKNEIIGVKGKDKFLPHLMGHEGFGIVYSVGAGVSKVKAGDYVVMHWRKGSGCDCFGGKYAWKNYSVGSGPVTTFSEFSIVAENRITPVDYEEDFLKIYPLLGCALSTSYGIVKNDITGDLNQKILIAGAGGIGLSIGFWLKILGYKNICMFDRFSEKRSYCEENGFLFYTEENSIDLFSSRSQNYSTCIDTTGSVNVISRCFDSLDKNGALILVGQPKLGSELLLNNPLKFFDGIKISASDGGGFNPDLDIPQMINLIRPHREFALSLVTDIIDLTQINKAIESMEDRGHGRVLIKF